MHGDDEDLALSQEDMAVLNTVIETGKPMVVVLLSGRPMIVTELLKDTDAFLAAWWLGTEGNGIADVIFGDYAPTGKLSVTWPTDMSQIPINVGDDDYSPLFPVGYGLSY
jgi:beta-glucosidase